MDANIRNRWFLDPGPLSSWIDQFADDLAAQRYTPLTIGGYTASARHFAAWRGCAGISIDLIDDDVVRRFAEHRCRCPGGRQWLRISPKYSRRARRFVVFLQKEGVARPPLKVASPYPLLDDYQSWLRVHPWRNERSPVNLRHLHKLLPELGTPTLDYDAALIRNVVREWRERTGPADLRTITSALRSYLRFLAGAGLCRPNLDHAVPQVLQWRAFRLCHGISQPPMSNASLHPVINLPEGACGTVQSCSYWLAWGCGPETWPDSDSAISNGRRGCCA